MPPKKNKSKAVKAKKKKPTMAKPQAMVTVKPPQKPKYNVLGSVVGGVAKALDNRYTGGLGQKIWTALTGSGDYVAETKEMPFEVDANTVVHPTLIPTVPHIANDGGMVRIRHREFVTNIIITTAGVSNGKVTLQPGDASAFPWLNALANRFQQYKILGGVFEYVTLCGNAVAAAVPALGQISVVAQYDVSRGVMTDQREILNTYYANSGVISADMMMPLECETTEQPCQVYFVRNPEGKTQPQDLRWYDFARLEYTIIGAPPAVVGSAGYVAGQLWFTYDLLLIKPVIHAVQDFPVPFLNVLKPGEDGKTALDAKEAEVIRQPPTHPTGAASRGWYG